MKIAIIAHGVFLDEHKIAAGNSVRAYYLAKALARSGHEIVYYYPEGLGRHDPAIIPDFNVSIYAYHDPGHLKNLINDTAPACLLVGYWELLGEIPENIDIPVIADLVAPRILEAIFQPERSLKAETQKMLDLYRRADFFLVGNQRQRNFLLPWLIMAGFDCRWHIPIGIVPISAEPPGFNQEKKYGTTLHFVSGGVSWPWRRSDAWFDIIADCLERDDKRRGKLVLFQGGYIYSSDCPGKEASSVNSTQTASVKEVHPLLPYSQMRIYLEQSAHVGVELADKNVEREFSQSFRATEFLRAGLPVICNGYLELSGKILEYDAGWVVDSCEELSGLINYILDNPREVRNKSRNAIKLTTEELNCFRSIEPVLDFLAHPQKAVPGRQLICSQDQASAESIDNVADPKSKSITGSLKKYALSILGKGLRSISRKVQGSDAVLMVSRSDIFPPDHGAAVKIDSTAASISMFVDHVCLVTDDRREYHVYSNGVRQSRRYPVWISRLGPVRSLVRRRLLKKGIPAGDAFLYYPVFDWGFIVRTLYLRLCYPYRVFQAEFPAYARPCIWGRSMFRGKVVLAEHNVEYQRLQEQNPDMTAEAFEYLRNMELNLCSQSDHVVAVSENDRQTLIQDGIDPRRIHHIPHGINIDLFNASYELDVRSLYNIKPEEALLVYHGTYLYPPNLEAVRIMHDYVLPELKRQGISARLLAVGPHPPEEPGWNGVTFTGSVENVAPYLRTADVAVVPLLKGGGTRMKILDYFAAGIPVVSTSKGIEGLQVQAGVHAVVLQEVDEDFVFSLKSLLSEPDKASEIARNGRMLAEELDWKVIGRHYVDLMSGKR